MNGQAVEVLLAEDNDDDVVIIRKVFDQARLVNVIHVVKDGEETLAYLRCEGQYKDAKRPDLLLLDLNMPKKDGFQVLKDIKADPFLCQLPVVVLTTSQREEDVSASYRAGACSFVTKPGDFQQFQELVKAFGRYWTLVARVPIPGR